MLPLGMSRRGAEHGRQGNDELRALARSAFYADFSVVKEDDMLDDGKTKAGAAELL